MSDHTHVRDWLLEADLSDLRQPPRDVAAHIAQCARCQAALRTVLSSYQELDVGLSQLHKQRRTRHWWRWTPVPLAAAAVLALLLTRSQNLQPPQGPSPLLAQLMFPEPAVVVPPEGKEAVVIDKNEMTVVWLTEIRGKQ